MIPEPQPGPGPDLPSFVPVQDRVAAQPPGHTALRAVDAVLDYAELNARANQVAHRLGQGPAGGGPVGVCFERTSDAVVALLGVLRSGRAFLPLDARQPRPHLQELLACAGASGLVSRDDLWEPGSRPDLPFLALDRERAALDRESTCDPSHPVLPEDLAYCLFTSGSSGRPKCVEITHASLAAYPEAFNTRLELAAGDRYLHGASFGFSAALRQLLVPFSVGACVVLAASSRIRDPLGLLQLARDLDVTVLDWVPSYLRMVCTELERLAPEGRERLLNPSLRILLSSGEPLSWNLVQRWRDWAGPRSRVASCYGQTETAGLVAWYEVPPEPPPPASTWVPLGTALPQAQLHALDADLRPAPPGSLADLWVAGPCLARGYRGTAPLVVRRGGWPEAPLLLPTGDRVDVQASGGLTFAGRSDDQVKVNGIRVDLGEIEEALRSHPGVEDAVVVAVEDAEGGQQLHGFIAAGRGFDAGSLRRHLRARFPDHLQPHHLVHRDSLPRTLSGKPDRPALKAALEPAARTPAGPDVEDAVQSAWRDVLGPGAGAGDFFELGGDSLQAIRMLGRLASALQLDTPLIAAFFGDPTLEGLTRVIREGLAAGASTPLAGRARVPAIPAPRRA